jgi:SnoaL-like protein
MTAAHAALVDRYLALWNLPDEARRPAIDALFTEDCEYVDPLIAITGRASLDRYIGATRKLYPETRFRLLGRIDGHHGQIRFGWACGPADDETAPAALTGADVTLLAGTHRLRALYGFFDPTPAVAGAGPEGTLPALHH